MAYEETVYRRRAHILGDDDLMLYCFDVAAQDALEKGEDTCCSYSTTATESHHPRTASLDKRLK